ncbi:Vesicle-associated protein 1-1 [Dendrobium catenatum]|uniref:Vesicle-associated protein 1-1 n=1 Tax=Dendrobium catenatum TaxID=906689 RepID=A0A2I0WIP2_9ASPA|nr:Vesicle-associated protein 1-1 [Dendrobium catenatum]
MQAQREAPSDMQSKDKFLVQSVITNQGATLKDISADMFSKDSGNTVDEVKLRVVYVSPPQPPSPVPEGSEEGSSPRPSVSDNGHIASSEFVAEVQSVLDRKPLSFYATRMNSPGMSSGYVGGEGTRKGTWKGLSVHNKRYPRLSISPDFTKSDPMIVVYAKRRDGTLEEIGRIEVVLNSLNPIRVAMIEPTVRFEWLQLLVFQLYYVDSQFHNVPGKTLKLDEQQFMGEAICASDLLSRLTDEKNLAVQQNAKLRQELVVQTNKFESNNYVLVFAHSATTTKSNLLADGVFLCPL